VRWLVAAESRSVVGEQFSKSAAMQLGMIGLGRMGGNMVRRLLAGGHECAVYAPEPAAVQALAAAGAVGCLSLAELVERLAAPRVVWIMIPAGAVDGVIAQLTPLLETGDTIVDGGNSHYVEDIRRARALGAGGLHYVDVGVSGGVWGLENGYCQMIGGERTVFDHLEPVFATLAPGGTRAGAVLPGGEAASDAAAVHAKSLATAAAGYLYCGASGAGHFVKMVHNGIEYGLMAAYAEGLSLLRNADVGLAARATDAETAPLESPEHFTYEFDLAAVAEVWRHGSVIRSWLLDLIGGALARDPELERFGTSVADSGEGRWTVQAAIAAGVPTPVLATALFARFSSRGGDDFANRTLSALRFEFGGHTAPPRADAHKDD
jgi:6-phosphogluconate dehydrogenase